jgi:hypothetical protein
MDEGDRKNPTLSVAAEPKSFRVFGIAAICIKSTADTGIFGGDPCGRTRPPFDQGSCGPGRKRTADGLGSE